MRPIKHKWGIIVIGIILIVTPVAMYMFNLFPGVYTYEERDADLLVTKGMLNQESVSLSENEYSEQELTFVMNSADALQMSGFLFSSLIAINIGFVILNWNKPKLRFVLIGVVLLLLLIFSFFYIDQLQSINNFLME
ncbi:hypothetical protein MM326_01075 [Alkalihalobacillus sp. LMS6]|uniref:hypothetical protein n=1 Tax=Alkalihalobacillus sp. LMS6 TaxID=2924034 RepID=UPI0020D0F72B|nr:hypothetical protein [Alkalihalobacillus sp. LMS6]UTR06657.1 hypothetical protein MM326_01075 [Alkalihalobacillus sp. LMS6]